MPDIFPSADQLIADVTVELDKLEVDYVLDYTYDARPYLRVSDEGHEKWKATQPEPSAETAAENDAEKTSDSKEAAAKETPTETASDAQSAKTTPKRR